MFTPVKTPEIKSVMQKYTFLTVREVTEKTKGNIFLGMSPV
jgi:hypothetical protein